MSVVKLPGLSGSNPLGAMASFGLFRVVAGERAFGDARLTWYFDADWRPELHTSESCDLESLIRFLIERQPLRTKARLLNWNDDIKSSPEVFRELWQSVRREYVSNGDSSELDELASFLSAYGSEQMKDKKAKPDIKPSALHMTAGQQRFLKSVKEVADSLDPDQRASKRQKKDERLEELTEAYSIALQGPWSYKDSNHSLGWDPATESLYALSDISPSDAGPRSVRAAVWLAFESLPLFPSVPVGNRLRTAGFDPRSAVFTWPLWDQPITTDTLAVLLSSSGIQQPSEDSAVLAARGIRSVMRSQCVRDANGRGTFRISSSVR